MRGELISSAERKCLKAMTIQYWTPGGDVSTLSSTGSGTYYKLDK